MNLKKSVVRESQSKRAQIKVAALFVLPALALLPHCSSQGETENSTTQIQSLSGPFQAGTYSLFDGHSFAIDGGFYHWSKATTEELYALDPNNSYQQWKFSASGTGFSICNVGDGASACLSDGGSVLQVGVASDAWSVSQSGSGYAIQNQRTGRYITDPGSPGNSAAVPVSTTATAWSLGGNAFAAGTYTFADSKAFALDGGFYHWNKTTGMELYALTAGNTYQEWQFTASGSGFAICNVGNGADTCLSDGNGVLQIAAATDVWSVVASGAGFTVQNQRTGRFITDPSAPGDAVAVSLSTTASVWSLALVGAGTPPPTGPGFYVATNGNDANPGTLAQPFASLRKAQTAMQASATVKTTYLRAGTYEPAVSGGNCHWGDKTGSSLSLTSADNGETWSYYAPDGYGSAIIDGGSTIGNSGGVGGNGTGCGFGISYANDITIIGLQFQHYLYSSVWAYGAQKFSFTDNNVHDITAAAVATGAVFITDSPGAQLTNNYVHDTAYIGLVVDDTSATGTTATNGTVASNVVINTCTWPVDTSNNNNDQNGGDCAAIYIWSKVTSHSAVVVKNNWVEDVSVSSNGHGDWGVGNAIGIYFDDGVSNATATGNVVTGIKSSCFLIHGGQNNTIDGNLCDIGPSSSPQEIVFYQNDGFTPMTGNTFQNNVVVGNSAGGGASFLGSSPPNPMTIRNNAYFNYGGSGIWNGNNGGAGADANPTYENPSISCWSANVAGAKGAPVGFPGIAGGFGPPGFTIPQRGTPPSWPHGC